MDLVRTLAPTLHVLTLDEAKEHLRIDFDDKDSLIQDLMEAAEAWLDGHSGLLGRCLLPQTWRVSYDYSFPGWRIPLPLAPLISVASVEYVDSSGVLTTVDPSVYQVLDGPTGAIQPAFGQFWPAPRTQARAVQITFDAGYPDVDSVPRPIKAALKLMIAHLFDHPDAVVGVESRDSSTPLPLGVDALIAPYRARFVA